MQSAATTSPRDYRMQQHLCKLDMLGLEINGLCVLWNNWWIKLYALIVIAYSFTYASDDFFFCRYHWFGTLTVGSTPMLCTWISFGNQHNRLGLSYPLAVFDHMIIESEYHMIKLYYPEYRQLGLLRSAYTTGNIPVLTHSHAQWNRLDTSAAHNIQLIVSVSVIL